MKKIIIAVVVVILIALGIYFISKSVSTDVVVPENPNVTNPTTPVATTSVDVMEQNKEEMVIGKSAGGNDIMAYHYGTGDTELLFVGGIHGGYEWNTVLVAYQLMDYLKANPELVPENVKVTVIPVLNPDGLKTTVGTTSRFSVSDVPSSQDKLVAGRFNGNNVDLNRNFECDWQAVGKWQNRDVSGGTAAFSEPESMALKNYVDGNKPTAVVAWYSSAGGVFASSCHNGVSTGTAALTDLFAKASGYKAYQEFDFYEITGDMVNWFAKNNVPAISVLLTNHTDTEWSKNRAGIDAMLKSYAK